jgi:hypothetical protein
MNTLLQLYRKVEELLGNLPRVLLLLMAVYFMRNPFVNSRVVELSWYFKWPAEFVVLLFLALAASALLRLARSHGNESPADQALARAGSAKAADVKAPASGNGGPSAGV